MKRALICFLMAAMLLGTCLFAVSAAGTGSLSATSASGYRGDTVTVSVNLNKNPGLITMKLQVSYSNNLTLVSVSNSGLLSGWTTPSPTISSPYTLRWADSLATSNSTATGKLVTLTFKIAAGAAIGKETVTVTFNESRDASGGKNTFSGTSATITVNCKHSFGGWTKLNDTQHQRTCSICKETEKVGHSWDSGTVTKKATCKEAGSKLYTCTGCKAQKTETVKKTTDHKYGTYTNLNTSSHSAVCTVCQTKSTESHNWNTGKVTKAATCQEAGNQTRTCKNCSATKEEALPKAAHSFASWESVNETTHSHRCTVCQLTETKEHTFGAALLHDATAHFAGCSDCNFTKDQQDHVPGPAATATADQICTVCNRVLQLRTDHAHELQEGWLHDDEGHWNGCSLCQQKCNFAAHTYENNCQTQCTVCAAERTVPHDPDGNWGSDGQGHWQLCGSCGEKVLAGAHNPGPEATTVAAQCCTDCSYQLTPVLPHEHFDANHSHICACGETYDADTECPICKEARKDFPWWILCAVEAVLLAVSVGFNFYFKKKKSDDWTNL